MTTDTTLANGLAAGLYTPLQAMNRLLEVKSQLEDLEAEKEALSAFLATQDLSDTVAEYHGRRWKATTSIRMTPKVNLMRLKAKAPALFEMITKPAVDSAKLHESLDAGYWTPELREECVTIHESRPGVRFTPIDTTTEENDA